MKINKLFFLILLSVPVHAQQNLFNVPSSDMTEHSEVYIQEQLNIGRSDIYSNLTTIYGLGGGFEAGVNIFGLGTKYSPVRLTSNGSDDSNPYSPSILCNVQKIVDLTELFHVALGTQTGTNVLLSPGVTKLLNFTYLNFLIKEKNSSRRLVVSTYYGNQAFRGSEGFGFMLGVEWPVIEGKIHLMMDYISGNSPISVAVLGAGYFILDTTMLSLGYQPAVNGNDSEVVFELTIGG